MDKREEMEERASDYAKSVKRGMDVAYAEVETREDAAYDKGFQQGIRHAGSAQWRKLFGVMVAGSAIGCGLILALAVGLTNLPPHA